MRVLGTLIIVISFLLSCGEKSFTSGAAGPKPAPQTVNQQPQSGFAFQPVSYDAQQSLTYPVDIMFLIDGSDSMNQYAGRVLNNLPVLIQAFQSQNSGFDYQIYAIMKTCHL